MPPFLMVDFSSLTLHFFFRERTGIILGEKISHTDMHTCINLLAW